MKYANWISHAGSLAVNYSFPVLSHEDPHKSVARSPTDGRCYGILPVLDCKTYPTAFFSGCARTAEIWWVSALGDHMLSRNCPSCSIDAQLTGLLYWYTLYKHHFLYRHSNWTSKRKNSRASKSLCFSKCQYKRINCFTFNHILSLNSWCNNLMYERIRSTFNQAQKFYARINKSHATSILMEAVLLSVGGCASFWER